MILAGDIGGTKTELALFENVKERKILLRDKFFSGEHASLEEIIEKFLSSKKFSPTHACFGIAGPIKNNTCKTTNLPWVIEAKKIETLLNIPSVSLINDLEANAWGISCLAEDELYTLSPGSGNAAGNKALISAGTGLGEAGLYFDGKHHIPFSSEGGHCNFAPTNAEEMEILSYLMEKYGHVSYERLLCGAGLANIYRFYVDAKKEKELSELVARFPKEDPAKLIHEYGSTGKCPLCKKAVERFISIYGSEAGNVALKFLAIGGVYIGGGIAPKMLDMLKGGNFLRSFTEKGRFKNLLSDIKIEVILNPHTALLGSAAYVEYKRGTA